MFKQDHFTFWQKAIFKFRRPWMNDKTYAGWMLKRRLDSPGDIDNPKTFNEKIQWLKLYNRNPRYCRLADKYAVREYISGKIGDSYLNKLYAVYDKPEDIRLADLPDRFVLKATHGNGMNLIVPDKSAINERKAQITARRWLSSNYYRAGREWVYKGISRRVLCERLLTDYEGAAPMDYKIFCFNGLPRFIQVDVDRFQNHTRAFFDTEWRRQDFSLVYEETTRPLARPERLEEMIRLAHVLAEDIPFLRVDLYALPQPVFGEMTFYPENGFGPFRPAEWDARLGQLLRLSL